MPLDHILPIAKNAAVNLYRITQLIQRNHQQYVLVMGHMRSGSSVLFRVLSSSSEINGLGERNAKYLTDKDLWKLALTTRLGLHLWKPSKYYIDQVNHNKFTPELNLFRNENIKIILLYRKPHATISSIIQLSEKYYKNNWSLEKATAYYIERIAYLKHVASQMAESIFPVSYEELIAFTDHKLSNISTFLKLDQPLINQYDISQQAINNGDRSEHIKKGKIIDTQQKLINLPSSILEPAIVVYDELTSLIRGIGHLRS